MSRLPDNCESVAVNRRTYVPGAEKCASLLNEIPLAFENVTVGAPNTVRPGPLTWLHKYFSVPFGRPSSATPPNNLTPSGMTANVPLLLSMLARGASFACSTVIVTSLNEVNWESFAFKRRTYVPCALNRTAVRAEVGSSNVTEAGPFTTVHTCASRLLAGNPSSVMTPCNTGA